MKLIRVVDRLGGTLARTAVLDQRLFELHFVFAVAVNCIVSFIYFLCSISLLHYFDRIKVGIVLYRMDYK